MRKHKQTLTGLSPRNLKAQRREQLAPVRLPEGSVDSIEDTFVT